MNPPLPLSPTGNPPPFEAAPFLDAAFQSTAALALAALVCLLWRRASAAERHRVWFLGLLGTLLWPLLSVLAPDHRPSIETLLARAAALSPRSTPPAPAPGVPAAHTPSQPVPPAPGGEGTEPTAGRFVAGEPSAFPPQPAPGSDWSRIGLTLWGLGAAAWLLRSGIGRWQLGRLRREGRTSDDPAWDPLLVEVADRVGNRRAVRLLFTPLDQVPLTFGAWRPVILLPAAAKGWSVDRRRAVLAHELGHVRRWDCLTQAIAEVVCALLWVNPLVWFAAHRLRVEREFACDDLVLQAGWKATEYAGHLVDLVGAAPSAPGAGALGVGHRPRIEARVASIVADLPPARRAPGRIASVLLLAGLAVGGWACPRATEGPAAPGEARARSTTAATPTAAKSGTPEVSGFSRSDDPLEALQRAADRRRARIWEIEDQLAIMREKLRIAETPNGELVIAEGPGSAGAIATRISSVRSELIRAQATLERLSALEPASLRSVLLTLQADDQMLQHLCLRQADADLELVRVRAEFGESHPDFVKARTAVDLLEKKITERIRGILEGLEARRAAYTNELTQLEEDARRSESEAIARTKSYREYMALREQLAGEKRVFDALIRQFQDGQLEADLGPLPKPPARAER